LADKAFILGWPWGLSAFETAVTISLNLR